MKTITEEKVMLKRYRASINQRKLFLAIGIYEGVELTLLGNTKHKDYTLVQIHKKVVAIPSELISQWTIVR